MKIGGCEPSKKQIHASTGMGQAETEANTACQELWSTVHAVRQYEHDSVAVGRTQRTVHVDKSG
jgi:hypothetical protein